MKFSLVIHSPPYSSEAAHTALRFTRALLQSGHEVHRLFFFGSGVYNANRFAITAQDEENVQHAWNKLIQDENLEAIVCVTSALKHGIVNSTEARRHELNGDTLLGNFEIAGLGQLVDAMNNSDRVINFG